MFLTYSHLIVMICPKFISMLLTWAIKMAASASYSAVPSMLMVAPTGSTKRVTLLSTLLFSSKHLNVTGRVAELEKEATEEKTSVSFNTHTRFRDLRDFVSEAALEIYLDDVPRAVIRACNMPVMKMKGFFRVMTKKSVGRIIHPWIRRPMMTVTVYMPSCPPISVMSSISTILPAIKKRIPMGAYLQWATIKQRYY